MKLTQAKEFIKIWMPILVMILTVTFTWGYTKSEIANVKKDVVAIEQEMVPRSELTEVFKRFDKALDRLEAQITRIEIREDKK